MDYDFFFLHRAANQQSDELNTDEAVAATSCSNIRTVYSLPNFVVQIQIQKKYSNPSLKQA